MSCNALHDLFIQSTYVIISESMVCSGVIWWSTFTPLLFSGPNQGFLSGPPSNPVKVDISDQKRKHQNGHSGNFKSDKLLDLHVVIIITKIV